MERRLLVQYLSLMYFAPSLLSFYLLASSLPLSTSPSLFLRGDVGVTITITLFSRTWAYSCNVPERRDARCTVLGMVTMLQPSMGVA